MSANARTAIPSRRQAGFTLVEIMVALALVTGLTMMIFSTLTPWLSMRQKVTTENVLAQAEEAIKLAYRANAMRIEEQSGATLPIQVGAATVVNITSSAVTEPVAAERVCSLNADALQALSSYLSLDSASGLVDGVQQPLCFFVSNRLSMQREGVTIYYHVVAVVSGGNNGKLEAGTTFAAGTGVLAIDAGGDDLGITISGFPIQYEMYRLTQQRIERVADLYSSYFTARYLGNPQRDYSVDYFVGGTASYYDRDATSLRPPGTGTAWRAVATYPSAPASLASVLGLGPSEQFSAYEDYGSHNRIEFANQALAAGALVQGVQVQEPITKGGGAALALPPYTALLRARLPGPSDNFLLRVVPGVY